MTLECMSMVDRFPLSRGRVRDKLVIRSRRRLTTVTCLMIGVLVVGSTLFLRSPTPVANYAPQSITNQSPAFAITQFTFTHGKKHQATTANAALAKLNDLLISAGILSPKRPRPWTIRTAQDTSVLWISFTHSNALVGNDPPPMVALLTRPDDVTERIDAFSMNNPNGPGYLSAWKLPALATNYSGWRFHVVTTPEGERLATFGL
jgi:hypothetical protein